MKPISRRRKAIALVIAFASYFAGGTGKEFSSIINVASADVNSTRASIDAMIPDLEARMKKYGSFPIDNAAPGDLRLCNSRQYQIDEIAYLDLNELKAAYCNCDRASLYSDVHYAMLIATQLCGGQPISSCASAKSEREISRVNFDRIRLVLRKDWAIDQDISCPWDS